jgi:hypothetical protein
MMAENATPLVEALLAIIDAGLLTGIEGGGPQFRP